MSGGGYAHFLAEEENKILRGSAETAGTTAAGTVGRAERLSVKEMSDGSCVNSYFNSGHRRDGSGFPGGGVGRQQLWARGGVEQWELWARGGVGQQKQQKFPRHQQRSPLHRQQCFRPPSQHPHQRGGPKSGPGGSWDCGKTPRTTKTNHWSQ